MEKSYCEIDVSELEVGGVLEGEANVRLIFNKGGSAESEDFTYCDKEGGCNMDDEDSLSDDDMAPAKSGFNLDMKMVKADGTDVDTSAFANPVVCRIFGGEGFGKAAF